jgi:chemotaxis protein MotB
MYPWKTNYNSGSWAVGSEGKKVVELGKVLGDNPDISVLIGHTDDDRFSASGPIADNWIYLLKEDCDSCYFKEKKNINKQNLTAAGRREFSPASNATAEGKAKTEELRLS